MPRTTSRPDLSGRPARRRKTRLIAERPPICVVCGEMIDVALSGNHPMGPTTEHIIPASKAPDLATLEANLALSHRSCNVRRGNRLLNSVRPKAQPTTSRSWA